MITERRIVIAVYPGVSLLDLGGLSRHFAWPRSLEEPVAVSLITSAL